ncbi:uncharacterized protein EV154DRAFT_589764 [Mucor mucedo]|uniref:uncharacterized protein n=1 Tax=Mucor mucedo TaxID=29922 RepID=UPI002220C2F9|nr:uncharacterized protein EV154DRAFT_589764 [Mucor mucedo]KAI7890864.1 hypothetical protein EV154DRAFT_589764 [Mucor mucedo]
MQNYTEERKLVVAENISEAEAEDAIDFNRESTDILLGKRKSPYNAFTEKLAATKKRDATAGVQSKGSIAFQKDASKLYKALNPAEKAALARDHPPVNKLTGKQKSFLHCRGVQKMEKMMDIYNAHCDSEFFLISMFEGINESTGKGRVVLYSNSVGEHCFSLKNKMGSELAAFLHKSRYDANERISKPYNQKGNLLRKEYSQRISELYYTHPSAKFAKAFPFRKFKDQTADRKMLGWPENVLVRRADEQTSGQMHLVLEAIKENKIYFAEAVDTTPATLEVSSPDLTH